MAYYSSNGQFGSGWQNPQFGGQQGTSPTSFPSNPYGNQPRDEERERKRREEELERLRYQQQKKALEDSIYGPGYEPPTEAERWNKRLEEKMAIDAYMNYGREDPMLSWFKSFMEKSWGNGGGNTPSNPQMPSWNEPSAARIPAPYSEPSYGGGGGGGSTVTPTGNGWGVATQGGGGSPSRGWTPDMAQGVPKSSVDPMEVIRSAKPLLEREAEQGMAAAAHRFGQSGAPIQSGYMDALAGAQQNSLDRLNNTYMNTLSQSAEAQAAREQQAQQAGLDRSLSAWGTEGDWDQARRQRGFNAWAQQGDWQYGADQNRLGRSYDAWGQQGQWGQQNADRSLQTWLANNSQNQSEMQMMMQLLAGLGG
jgi:hypothetical protein